MASIILVKQSQYPYLHTWKYTNLHPIYNFIDIYVCLLKWEIIPSATPSCTITKWDWNVTIERLYMFILRNGNSSKITKNYGCLCLVDCLRDVQNKMWHQYFNRYLMELIPTHMKIYKLTPLVYEYVQIGSETNSYAIPYAIP